MRQRTVQLLFVCAGLIAACPSNFQGQPSDADPNQFMRAAAASNSMIAPGMKPWHVRAKYQQFAKDGSIEHQGVFEIWWAAPDKFKTSITSAGSERVDYRAGKDAFFTGEADSPPLLLRNSIPNLLLHPLPSEAEIANSVFNIRDTTIGGAELKCYFEIPSSPSASGSANVETTPSVRQEYCFKGVLPVLRASQTVGNGGAVILSFRSFNSIVSLRGHYFARSVRVSAHGNPWLNIEVDVLEPTLGVDEAALIPPPDAKSAPTPPINVAAGALIHSEPPVYPEKARMASIQGTVVLGATISKQGTVEDIRVIGGPPALQQAAMDAVKNWKYEPYTINGQAVEVHTEINVAFSLQNH